LSAGPPLLEVQDLEVHFPIRGGLLGRPRGAVRAVDGVSFTIGRGETFGLVGESGCGKTTAGLAILRMIEPSAGEVRFEGRPVAGLAPAELRAVRRQMQIVFQDPFSSLNPRMTVGESIGEPLLVHGVATGAALERQVRELLERVGLPAAAAGRHPHQFSGGQRQRVVIARALALRPKLIVCDEPVSALDVSVQSQILNLLGELQQAFGVAYLFISHDLSVVRHISDRVGVMYLGRLVELAETDALFARPQHPYTEALMSAIPVPDPGRQRARRRIVLEGELPSPAAPPPGCRFHTRCPYVFKRCPREEPALLPVGPGHDVACHLREASPP